jgi:O-6-methylguanine DNA methyltransferase
MGTVQSDIGPMVVAYGDAGVRALRPATEPGDRDIEPLEGDLARRIERRLAGDRARLEVDLSGLTEFQREVLRITSDIPRGQVRTYAWIALRVGRPRAVRAVGSALARNPVPLIIPCHRVVRSDGRIGEYGCGGPSAKTAILTAEGVDVGNLREVGGLLRRPPTKTPLIRMREWSATP